MKNVVACRTCTFYKHTTNVCESFYGANACLNNPKGKSSMWMKTEYAVWPREDTRFSYTNWLPTQSIRISNIKNKFLSDDLFEI